MSAESPVKIRKFRGGDSHYSRIDRYELRILIGSGTTYNTSVALFGWIRHDTGGMRGECGLGSTENPDFGQAP